mgnify:CR=1 FL=1
MISKKNLFLLACLLILIFISAWLLPIDYFKSVYYRQPDDITVQNRSNPTSSKPDVNVEIILDVSGSMWGQFDGASKILNSKGIMEIILKDLPKNVKVGFRTFGGDGESRLEVPLDIDNRDKIKEMLKDLRPSGKSPIGYALEEARKDLDIQPGSKFIILISDGIDNGELDPVKKAEELKKQGIVTHVVFLRSNEQDGEKMLARLAQAGGGHFFTIDEKDLVVPTMTLTR